MKLLFQCPVCLNYSLEEPAYLKGVGSDEICYICGFQFGLDDYPDKDEGIVLWRTNWEKMGSPTVRYLSSEEKTRYYKVQQAQ